MGKYKIKDSHKIQLDLFLLGHLTVNTVSYFIVETSPHGGLLKLIHSTCVALMLYVAIYRNPIEKIK